MSQSLFCPQFNLIFFFQGQYHKMIVFKCFGCKVKYTWNEKNRAKNGDLKMGDGGTCLGRLCLL